MEIPRHISPLEIDTALRRVNYGDTPSQRSINNLLFDIPWYSPLSKYGRLFMKAGSDTMASGGC